MVCLPMGASVMVKRPSKSVMTPVLTSILSNSMVAPSKGNSDCLSTTVPFMIPVWVQPMADNSINNKVNFFMILFYDSNMRALDEIYSSNYFNRDFAAWGPTFIL